MTPCLTKRGKYSGYFVAMSACVASSPSASWRSASSSRRAVTYDVRGVLLDQRARGQHHALAHFLHRHAVVEVLQRRLEDALGLDVGQALARFLDERGQALEVERLPDTPFSMTLIVVLAGLPRFLRLCVRALLRALLAVEHVGARDFVLAAAHQRELDLVLDLLDVDRAAFGLALHQRRDDGVGELRRPARARAREAAPWPPLTARNALVIAIVIFDGSKPTTAPLRRITLYCAKRGSAPLMTGLPGSPTRRSRGGTCEGLGGERWRVAWMFLLVESCRCDGFRRHFAASVGTFAQRPGRARVSEGWRLGPAPGGAPPAACGSRPGASRILLLNQNLLYLVFKCLLETKA